MDSLYGVWTIPIGCVDGSNEIQERVTLTFVTEMRTHLLDVGVSGTWEERDELFLNDESVQYLY